MTDQISKKQYNVARLSAIMNNLTRYCTTPSLIKESVSDHAFLISFLVIETSTEYPELFKYVSRENLLIRATLHDMVETVTGDIPSPAKRAISNGESLFNDIEVAVSDMICEGRSDEFRNLLVSSIKFDNKDNLEEMLFKTFDYYCVLIKTSNELYLGNRYYRRVVREMIPIINTLYSNICERSHIKGFTELRNFYIKEVLSIIERLKKEIGDIDGH